MTRPKRGRWRSLLIAQISLLGTAVVIYRLVGQRLLAEAYDGRSIGLLNRLFEGKSAPLSTYLIYLDSLVSDFLAAAVVILLLQIVVRSVAKRIANRRESTGAERRGEGVAAASLSPKKRAAFSAVLLAIPISLVVIPYAIRHASYMKQIEVPPGLEEGTYEPPSMPGLTPEQLLQVGKGHQRDKAPLRSYLRYPQAKPAGTIRIGIFGDSYAMGEEAAPEHDTATHLERLLEERGASHVDVINFGVSGFGVHQAAMLWEYLGTRYELDYTVMMPRFFHIDRDNSFLHTSHYFGPLHGVYAIAEDTLRYVPVIGKDRLDSCRRYFSIVQPAQYWRYDTRVPMAFRPLLPSPLDRRGNPFYYQRDEEGATLETYRRLLRKISLETGPLIVFTDEVLFPSLVELQSDRIYVLASRLEQFRARGSCLYTAPFDHPSGIAYEIYARELSALLSGEERPVYPVLRVSAELAPTRREVEIESNADSSAAAGAIDSDSDGGSAPDRNVDRSGVAGEVRLRIGAAPVGSVRTSGPDGGRSAGLSREVPWGEGRIASLAVCWNEDGVFFVPLPFSLREGDEVSIEWSRSRDTSRIPIGHVTGVRGPVGRISIDWSKLEAVRGEDYSFHRSSGEGMIEMHSRGQMDDVRLLIGGKAAFVGQPRPQRPISPRLLREVLLGRSWVRTRFRPASFEYGYIRADAGDYVEVERLPSDRGTVDLAFQDGDEETHVLPLLEYERITVVGDPFDPPFSTPLERPRTGPVGERDTILPR